MAHGNYHCCAVCDSSLAVATDAPAKGSLCSRCAVKLACLGVIAYDVGELTAWMQAAPPEEVIRILDDVGFQECFYPNDVDQIYRAMVQ